MASRRGETKAEVRKQKRELAALDVEPLPAPSPWVNDAEVDTCGVCSVEFGFFVRKHHCRVCGGIYCADCSSNRMELPEDLYKEYSGEQRVCHLCYANYMPFSDRMLGFIEKECAVKGVYAGPDYVTQALIVNSDGTFEKRLFILAEYRLSLYRTEYSTFEEGFEADITEEKYHILDLSALRCDGSHVIILMLTNPWHLFDPLREVSKKKKKVLSVKLILPRAGHLVALLRKLFRKACFGVVPLPVELAGQEFGKEIVPLWDGDYADVYRAICAYMGTDTTPAITEVMSFLTQLPSPEVDFGLISDPSYPVKSVNAAAASLRFHPHFQKIIFDDRVGTFVFDALRLNDVVHTLIGKGLWSSTLLDFSAAIPHNPNNALQIIHLEECRFSHESILSFSTALSTLNHGIHTLSLPYCSLKGKDVVAIIGGVFLQNFGLSGTLKKVNLSGNDVGKEGSEVLGLWLENLEGVGDLERLVLVECGLVIRPILSGVRSVRPLRQLDLSKNRFQSSDIPVLTSFCEKSPSLTRLGLSGCDIPPDGCVEIVTSLMCNQHLQGLHLDLSYNHMDKKHAFDFAGPQDIYGTITSLDVSGMFSEEESFQTFCDSVAQSENPFETIIFDNCLFSNSSSSLSSTSPLPPPSRALTRAIRAMCDACPMLRALSFQGSFRGRFSPHLGWLCEEFETQNSLLEINLANNEGGDGFAYALGRVLRKNGVLASVGVDGNGVSVAGFRIIRASLFDNSSLQLMGFQWDDSMLHGHPTDQLSSTLMDIQMKTICNTQEQEYPFESILSLCQRMEDMEEPPDEPPPLSHLPHRLVASSFVKSMKRWQIKGAK